MADSPESWQSRTRRVRDVANILPFLAALLLLPPVLLVFSRPVSVGGIPLIVLYLYLVWAGVILVAFFIARRLAKADRFPDG